MTIQFLKNLDSIDPYIGGMPIEELSRKIGIPQDKIIKLASNENPYGISPHVKEVLVNYNEYELYPDGSGYNLIKKPVDIKALRKYLANKFSFRGLVPYHADGGVGMKVSYEIV